MQLFLKQSTVLNDIIFFVWFISDDKWAVLFHVFFIDVSRVVFQTVILKCYSNIRLLNAEKNYATDLRYTDYYNKRPEEGKQRCKECK